MKPLLLVLVAVFLPAFLSAPTAGAGWFWDAGNGLGFVAFAGLLYLGITSYRRIDVRAHRLLGYAVLLIAVAHALWFLLGDAAAIEYIKFSAPAYMWMGIVGLLLLFVLVIISLVPDRLRVHKDYPMFLYWHRVLAIATVACCAYHIVVSGFYLAHWYQAVLFVVVATATSIGRPLWVKFGPLPVVTPVVLLLITVLFTGVFSLIRNIPL